MCVTALVASTLVSAVGGFVQAGMASAAAESEAAFRNYQLEVQNKQLEEDRKMAELQALQTENARLLQARKIRAQNEAFIAASGVGESRSFLQGADVASEQNLRQDVANLRLTNVQTTSRIADQIAVNRAEGAFQTAKAGMTGQSAYINAAFNAASSGLNNYTKYAYYKTR
jgi:hypothetical protein